VNIAWAKDWMSKFNAAGLEQLASMYAERVDFEDVTLAHKAGSREELKSFFGGFFTGAGEHSFVVKSYTGSADGGAVQWTWHAKHGSDLMGVPAKGKETQVDGVSVLSFEGGKIVSQRDFWDAATLLRQLGALK
jgi:steroid delta-isomerase-like uncharacterized protein